MLRGPALEPAAEVDLAVGTLRPGALVERFVGDGEDDAADRVPETAAHARLAVGTAPLILAPSAGPRLGDLRKQLRRRRRGLAVDAAGVPASGIPDRCLAGG